jgi:hypothetical protein
MKFYSRKKQYKYSAGLVFFWKYKSKDDGWRQRQVYWGNRETDAIVGRYDCIKRIAQLSDGLERKDLIRRTLWLNRGIEDYSDEHFSESIYLRLQELKKQTPELPKPKSHFRSYRRSMNPLLMLDNVMANLPHKKLTREQNEKIRKLVMQFRPRPELFGKEVEKYRNGVIKRANQIREFGEKLEMLIGGKKFLKRHFEKFQSSFSADTTCKLCQLAMVTWRENPAPIDNQNKAEYIVSKEIKIMRPIREKKLRKQALAAVIKSKKTCPNLVPTIQVTVNSSKPQFCWDFLK